MNERLLAWGSRACEPLNHQKFGHQKLGLLIASDVRFLREGLAEFLEREDWITVIGTTSVPEAVSHSLIEPPDFVLLDAGVDNGLEAVWQFHRVLPRVRVIAMSIAETEQSIVSWAEAGVAGYIPRSAGRDDFVQMLMDISRGRQPCPSSVTFDMLRRLVHSDNPKGKRDDDRAAAPLTGRELEISALIEAGLSNKEIARRLNIGVSTTKSHVHNLLGKLNIQRRGQIAASALRSAGPTDRPSPANLRP